MKPGMLQLCRYVPARRNAPSDELRAATSARGLIGDAI